MASKAIMKLQGVSGEVNDMDENKVWTDEDIGEEVEITIEGIRYYDTIIEMWLPDGQ